ncbi:hypothetical protein ACIPW9_00785 [Streptomyces sp. NPDC090052]|uniref:hypothetical protein n=1 Tax=Streptomyces sp. NPDC090052 TaxID=3365931 RepID=UPI0037F459D5
MLSPIAHVLALLLRFLWPASGRHRQRGVPRPSLAGSGATTRRPSPYATPLRGEDTLLVRPYLLAHEQRAHAQQQRARRRALWLAVHGVDVGPRWIHGIEVAA